MNFIKIVDKKIGGDSPTFIIAEIGVNHNGSVELAKEMIDNAKAIGADAVKFQTFKTESLVKKSLKDFFEMVKKLELADEDFLELSNYAKKKNIIFFSTPTDEESIDLLYKQGIPALKIASGDITHLPFIGVAAEKNVPIILSTGMSNLGEIEEAIDTIYFKGNHNLALMHCVSSYPASVTDLNLNVIQTLKQAFGVPVGFSDHSQSKLAPIIAATMGADIIEKHFTLDKEMEGPDQKSSADVEEFEFFVNGIREMESMRGSYIKKPVESELEIQKTYRKSLVAKKKIIKGETINPDSISVKRPAEGIAPKYLNKVVGKKAKKDIAPEESIKWNLLL
jgi:N-acetylneuraminate synthase/N,N'-diacetyllegionaminate synthase